MHAALAHSQFEAIHPFLDGNGRVGRLLITLLLVKRGLIPSPLLYLSAYFEATRQEYYARLLRVTERGEWEEWLTYFLRGCFQSLRLVLDLMYETQTIPQRPYRRTVGHSASLTPASQAWRTAAHGGYT